jgi:hypothetical protein
VRDPILKEGEENCRDKMGKVLLKDRGQSFPFLAKNCDDYIGGALVYL